MSASDSIIPTPRKKNPARSHVSALEVLGRVMIGSLCLAGVCLPTALTGTARAVEITNAPQASAIVPTYRVQRFEIIGDSLLDQGAVNRLTAGSIGDAVTLSHLQRGLRKIQEHYRERGYPQATVTIPRQPLTNGIVQVRVNVGFPAASATTALPAWTVPAFDIREFEIRGNTALTATEIENLLKGSTGPNVSLDQLEKTLGALRTIYRQRGFPDATISLPRQVLLPNGKVTLEVIEGFSENQIASRLAAAAAVETNTLPTPSERTFTVQQYEIHGNTLLDTETIVNNFTDFVGTNITFKKVQQALSGLQLAYRERGFATVAVSLPPQQLTNAVIKVRVTEGQLADISVKENRYFSTDNVLRALPSLRTGEPLNSRILQRELDIANQNRDRQIYPVIGPGPDPGTSELTLKVKDRLPLHGRIELNNNSTPGTPDWRLNSSLQYNNLWQYDHQAGLSYGFTPLTFRNEGIENDIILNRPQVANGGAYYRFPFGSNPSVAEQIQNSGRFGYDEATRQFRLPPATTRPDLTIYGSASFSDTGVKLGPTTYISSPTNNPTLTSQDSGQNVTLNLAVGARLNVPKVLNDKQRLNFSAGIDWKRYELSSRNTNNYTSTYKFYDSTLGDQTIIKKTFIAQAVNHNEINYLPLFLGLDYFGSDNRGTTFASLGASFGFIGDRRNYFTELPIGSSPTNYPTTTKHLTDYVKINASFVRDLKFANGWSLNLRADGQAATGPLISNEQFALGGMNSVRGYYEGDESGDVGWAGSAEFRTPFISTTVPVGKAATPIWLRGFSFLDVGQRWILQSDSLSPELRTLVGMGFGISANLNNHVDARVTLGWPLVDSANTSANGTPRASLTIGGQF